MNLFVYRLIVVLLALFMTSCVPIRKGGSTYYVVLGAGIIRVRQTNDVTVVKSSTVGVFSGDGQTAIGISSVYSARVPTNANVILEVTP